MTDEETIEKLMKLRLATMAQAFRDLLARADATMTVRPALTVVVPCFNEAEGLEGCAAEITKWVDTKPPGSVEVLLVDDGSADWARERREEKNGGGVK